MPYRRKLAGKATRPSTEPHFHDYVVMVVLSVQNPVNLSVLKDWGCIHWTSLLPLQKSWNSLSFMFPDALLEQPFECYIAPNLSGPFQTVYLKNNK